MTMIRSDSGCKVGWETYDDKAEAEERSATAKDEAARLARQGYDFGYQSPGYVTESTNKETGALEWTVVVP